MRSSGKRRARVVARLASKKGDPIEFRPHAQHRLQSVDDSFDLRYSAYLWNQAVIEGVYQRVFEKASAVFTKNLLGVLSSPPRHSVVTHRVDVINVATDLSDLDRTVLLSASFGSLSAEHRKVVELSLEGECTFWEVCSELSKKLLSLCIPARDYHDLGETVTLSPLQRLHRALAQSQTRELVVAFPMADRLSPSILTALVRELEGSCPRLVVVCVLDPLAMGFGEEVELHGLADVAFLSLPAAREQFESIYSTLVVRARLSLGLPPWLLRHLSTEFEEAVGCCQLFTKRLLLLVRLHLKRRKGLLVMAQEVDWMRSMNLLSGRAASVGPADERDDSEARALAALLEVLAPHDLMGSALALPVYDTAASRVTQLGTETAHALKVLREFQDQHAVALCMLHVLQCLVRCVVPAAERKTFRLSELWPALMEPAESIKMWANLHTLSDKALGRQPVALVLSTVRDLCALLLEDRRVASERWQAFLHRQAAAVTRILCGLNALDVEASRASVAPGANPLAWQRWSLADMARLPAASSPMARTVRVEPPPPPDRMGATAATFVGAQELELSYIYEQLLADLRAWISRLTQDFAATFVEPRGLEALTHLAMGVAAEAHSSHFNGSLRSRFMEGSRVARTFGAGAAAGSSAGTRVLEGSQADTVRPDVCYLSQQLASSKNVEVAAKWFVDFQRTEQQVLARHPAMKRKAGDVLPKDELKARFLSSLYDLERAGALTIQTNSKKVALVYKGFFAAQT